MANIKQLNFFLILFSFFSIPACAQNLSSYAHLGYDGKKFTTASKVSSKDWSDPQVLERVWQASFIRIPEENGDVIKSTIADFSSKILMNGKKHPTVIYMHGCSGYWAGTIRRINFLAENGFAVIAPPSFALEKYPKSCDEYRYQGGLYRNTIKIRQNDAGYAIANAKQLPWVDEKNVFLMGLSEGGITTATFYSKDNSKSVNARVIEGWTCTSTWNEYKGIRAPKSEPVLSLLGSNDPWFQNPYTNGECTSFLNEKNGSKSIVYRSGRLSYKHELLEDDEAKKPVIEFLRKYLK